MGFPESLKITFINKVDENICLGPPKNHLVVHLQPEVSGDGELTQPCAIVRTSLFLVNILPILGWTKNGDLYCGAFPKGLAYIIIGFYPIAAHFPLFKNINLFLHKITMIDFVQKKKIACRVLFLLSCSLLLRVQSCALIYSIYSPQSKWVQRILSIVC